MSKIKSNIKASWHKIPKFFRVIFWIGFIWFILPGFIAVLLSITRYSLPPSDSLQLGGKQILTHKGQELFLYKFQSRDECRKNANKYTKTSASNCAEVITVADMFDNYTYHKTKNGSEDNSNFYDVNSEKKPVADYIQSAILSDGTVVWAEQNIAKQIWTIYKWKDGVKSVIKEYHVFDLDKFVREYHDGKVVFAQAELMKQTTVKNLNDLKDNDYGINPYYFKVTGPQSFAFLDFTISKVSARELIESLAIEREINLFNGEEKVNIIGGGGMDLKNYDYIFKDLSTERKFGWGSFKILWGGGGDINYLDRFIFPFNNTRFTITNDIGYYLNPEKTKKVYIEDYDIYGSYEHCSDTEGGFPFSIPCNQWSESQITVKDESKNSVKHLKTSGLFKFWSFPGELSVMKMGAISDKRNLLTVSYFNDLNFIFRGGKWSPYGNGDKENNFKVYSHQYIFDINTGKSAQVDLGGRVDYIRE